MKTPKGTVMYRALQAFRVYASQVMGKTYTTAITANVKRLEYSEFYQVWELDTKESTFEGVKPEVYQIHVFSGPLYDLTARKSRAKHGDGACALVIDETEKYAALISTDMRPVDYLGELDFKKPQE
jgi:hypothetical protein